MKVTENPYYHPEASGLEIFDDIDTGGYYEFNQMVIWRKKDDGTLWYESDSGCSCPTPFEYVTDLKELTKDTFYNFDLALKNHTDIETKDYLEISKKVKEYLDKTF